MTARSMPLPASQALRRLGRDLAIARRKRGISTADMAARLFVSRDTLWRLERGDPTVAIGAFATAAFVLNLHDRLANLAAPAEDELGLKLDGERLPKRIRRPRRGISKSTFKRVALSHARNKAAPTPLELAIASSARKRVVRGRNVRLNEKKKNAAHC